jgi:hypothetical protein
MHDHQGRRLERYFKKVSTPEPEPETTKRSVFVLFIKDLGLLAWEVLS